MKTDDIKNAINNAGEAAKNISPIAEQVAKVGTSIKRVIIIIIIAAVVILGLFLAFKFGLFRGDRGLKIDDTANVIDEIKKIGEFTSLCYYEEMALVDQKERQTKMTELTNSEAIDELVLIAHGKIRAGFDLSQLKENDINIKGDTLSIWVPKAEIFDIIVNPSDYEIFVEHGKWSHEQFTNLQRQATDTLKKHAAEVKLLEKAEETGIKKLDAFFRTFGFSEVFITQSKTDNQ